MNKETMQLVKIRHVEWELPHLSKLTELVIPKMSEYKYFSAHLAIFPYSFL